MSDKQLQKAGDNSQQIQAGTVIIQNGITEQRAREIYSEMSSAAISENTIEAESKAIERINKLEEILIPRLEQEDAIFECFADPSFQVLIKKAQLTSICTDRYDDYTILSELLVHRIKNKTDIKKKASISKAIEIIDQIDDDSLCAITMYHAILSFIPISGSIVEGIHVLSELYEKINPDLLPQDDMWIDNLSILGAITIIPFSGIPKYEEMFSKKLDGYVCVGIKKGSEEYSKAIELLHTYRINTSVLIDNEILDGYVRLAINEKSAIEDLIFQKTTIIGGQHQMEPIHISNEEKKCLYDIFDLYSKDDQLQEKVKENFYALLNSIESMKKTITWWNGLPLNLKTTSIGRVIAHTNAKRIDNSLPNLD